MNPFDVNDDGVVSPIDALPLINHFNSLGVGIQSEGLRHHQSRFYLDVSGDRVVSPLDALMIINQLNARTATRPEGESAGSGQYFAIPHSAIDRARPESWSGERTQPIRANCHGLVIDRDFVATDATESNTPRRRESVAGLGIATRCHRKGRDRSAVERLTAEVILPLLRDVR